MSQRQARHAIIILTKQYSGMDILSAIIISHMGFGVYMLILFLIVILLLICKGIMDDEMRCVIANENPALTYSCNIIKLARK